MNYSENFGNARLIHEWEMYGIFFARNEIYKTFVNLLLGFIIIILYIYIYIILYIYNYFHKVCIFT